MHHTLSVLLSFLHHPFFALRSSVSTRQAVCLLIRFRATVVAVEKTVIITQPVCVFVALGIQQKKRINVLGKKLEHRT